MKNRTTVFTEKMPPNFEVAIIKQPSNIFYFTGLDTHDAGTLLIFKSETYFIIDSRYIEIAQNSIKHMNVILEKNVFEQIAQLLDKHKISRVNLESSATYAYGSKIRAVLPGNIEIDTSDELNSKILEMRVVKSESELASIKKAQVITDACFSHIQSYIKPGVREIDIALEMETFMRKGGSKGLAFPTILVAGLKTSLPHGEPGENVIKEGDFVTLDFGAKVDGYCTDMTRTVAVAFVSDEQKLVYETVLKAQLCACENAKAGMRGCDVDKISRDIINKAGFGDYFGHGLGHSLGIEVHENPRYSPACKDVVPAGALMTIEPGIYLPGKFGVRIEDTVLVKEDNVQILGTSDKNLIIL